MIGQDAAIGAERQRAQAVAKQAAFDLASGSTPTISPPRWPARKWVRWPNASSMTRFQRRGERKSRPDAR